MVVLFLYVCGVFMSFAILIIYWILILPQKRIYNALRSQGVPGEPFIPLIGQLSDMNTARNKDALMTYHMELVRKHGRVYILGFGPSIRVSILEPDMIADILARSNAEVFIRTSDNGISLRPLLGKQNLVMTNGLEHDRARKMLNPAFHFINLQSMVSIMTNQTTKAIDELLTLSNEKQLVDLQKEIQSMTLTIIASCAFGNGFENMTNGKEIVSRAFTVVLDAVLYRVLHLIDRIPIISRLPFWNKPIVDKGCREVTAFVERIINERRHGRSTSQCSSADILDLLLSAVDDDGKPFNDQEIKDQALTFVFAGHETTANLITWTMYVLMTNKEVWRACREEVDRVLPDDIEPTYENLNELVVCEAILKETLRFYPPAPIYTRQCTREYIIGSNGHWQLRIPVGTTVALNIYALHRDAEFWPRPLEFDYTRWMRDPVTGLKPTLAHPFCYLPFGAGPRNCIGQNFALIEAKIIVAMLVQRCDFEMEPDQKITPDIRITMRSKYGLRARVNRRL